MGLAAAGPILSTAAESVGMHWQAPMAPCGKGRGERGRSAAQQAHEGDFEGVQSPCRQSHRPPRFGSRGAGAWRPAASKAALPGRPGPVRRSAITGRGALDRAAALGGLPAMACRQRQRRQLRPVAAARHGRHLLHGLPAADGERNLVRISIPSHIVPCSTCSHPPRRHPCHTCRASTRMKGEAGGSTTRAAAGCPAAATPSAAAAAAAAAAAVQQRQRQWQRQGGQRRRLGQRRRPPRAAAAAWRSGGSAWEIWKCSGR